MDEKKHIVYYNGFWYSSFSPIGTEPYDLVLNERKLFERIKSDLRLLSLIFDTVHIPRSHLLTFHTNTNWTVIRRYFLDKDFDHLVEHNILLSSSLPHIDEYSDSERILERVKSKGWSKTVDDNFIKSIKHIAAIKIDSARESKSNVDKLQVYIELLKSKNRKIANELSELVKKSNYKTIPFLHEMFVEELHKNNKIDFQSKESIWRFTNSMYMSTGGYDLGDNRSISLNVSIEDKLATHDNTGLLRELYSPNFIGTLITEELGDKYLMKYLTTDINSLLKFRQIDIWSEFKENVFEIFRTLTQIEKIKPKEFAVFNDQQKLLSYRKYILGGEKGDAEKLINGFLESASNVYDPIAGESIESAKTFIAKRLIKYYSDWKVSGKIKYFKPFWKKLKLILDSVD